MKTALTEKFDRVHPHKRVPAFCPYDYRGERLPRDLHEVYGRYSEAKRNAHEYCKRLFCELDGEDFAITSHNTFMFVVQFNFRHPETGVPMVARITREHNECWYVG